MKIELNTIGGKIDSQKGTISDISLMRVGEAKGHGCFIDLQTLQDIWTLAQKNPVKSYLRHSDNPDPSEAIGLFSSLYIDQEEGSLRAVQFQALKSWKESEPHKFSRLFELAETAPSTFGVSLSVAGPLVWKTATGEELPYEGDQPEGSTGPFLRVTMIDSADFVSAPAANNKGLFSVPVQEEKEFNTKDKLSMKKIYEKFSANEKALIKAVKLSAENDTLTDDQIIETVQAEISADEVAAIKTENETLKARIAELEGQFSEVTKAKETADLENTELKTKLSAKGAKPLQLGVKSEERNETLDKYYALESDKSAQLSFYRENEKELKKHFFARN